MRIGLTLLTATAMLAALGGCGRREAGAGGVTSDEERQLDNAGAMTEDNGVFDVSADGLSANAEDVAADENEAGAAPAAAGNAQAGNRQ